MSFTPLLSRYTRGLRHLGVLAFAAFALLASPAADAAYVQVYSTIQKGALTFTGNTLVLQHTTTSGTGGAYVAAGAATQVVGYPVGTTTDYTANASRAQLTIPAGATVLYAELIWTGTIGANTAAILNGNVNFTTPSGATYSIASSAATAGANTNYYTRSANVTGLVQLGGSGTYTTGRVPGKLNTTTTTTDGAGWTLAVAYADPAQVARNLTIFVGAELTTGTPPPPASVSGFCTPVAGPVNGRLLVSPIEGDAAIGGDEFRFGATSTLATADRLSGPNNLATNFFAGQINGNTGTLDTSGTFGTSNQPIGGNTAGVRQGYDITNVDISAFLKNSQTTAYAQGFSTGDVYGIDALGLQINVTSPIFPVTVKSVNKTSTFVGDTLRYSVNLDNTAGNGAATNVTFFDAIPPGMVLVPNSVLVNGVVQTGANPATGVPIGNVPVGSVVSVAFEVTVVSLPASPAPAKFDNAARWTYTYIACAGVVAQTGEVATNPVSTPAARLEPVKTVSPAGPLVGGQTATYTISIPNTGLLNTTGSTLADPIPAGTVYVAGSTKLNGVAVPDGAGGVMPYATAALINSAGQPAGVVAFGASATIQFSVAATSAATVLNTATIDPDGAGPGTTITVSAVNSGLTGPSVAKAFVPGTIGAGGKSTLTITLTNPNATAITGASVTDNLPSGMTIASPANASTTCVGGTATATPSGTTLALTAGTIPASGSCTLTADVTVATAGTYTNTIPVGAVSSTNAGLNTAGSQSLTVTPAPSVSKSFTPGTVAPNAVSSLSITLTNPTAAVLTAVSFSDIFPSTASGAPGNMTLFNTTVTNTCGGTLTDAAGAALAVGSAGIKLVGGSINANNVCTITVNVKAPTGGAYGNVIPVGALTTSGGANTAAAQATLQIASPQVDKTFGVAPGVKELTVAANTATILRITLTNVTGATITALAFTDTYPAGLVNANTTTTNTCGGTATASATATNPGTLVLSGATTLAAGASCVITANVQSATSGSYTNTIAAGGVTSSIGPNVAATSATLNVARPNITKEFSALTVPLNSTAALTITLSNPTATAMTGAAFTDTLPAGLTAATPGGTCVGTKAASGSTVSITGGTIPANGSCTVTAVVTGTTIGLKINTIPVGGLTVTGPAAASNGTAATDDITVLAAPTISKSFLTSPILPVTGVSTLQIVLANSNSVALTGATFTDTFPTAPGLMTLANLTTTNSCSGTLTDNANAALIVGSASVRLTGGVIPSNGSCTITVNVKANLAGDYLNTIPLGSLSTTNGGASTVAATAPLSVRLTAPTVTKSFSPSTIVANAATTMTLTIINPSTVQNITGAAWSDIFPSGMKVFSNPNFINNCAGTVVAGNVANDTSLNITGMTIPFNASGTGGCSISLAVTSTVVAASPGMTNTTGTVTSTNANTSTTASANLIVTPPPLTPVTISKVFLQPSISSGGISTIRFTLGSTNTGILDNANFTDTLTNMSVASAAIGGTCAGVTNSPVLVVGATGSNALNLTVPNIAPGGCTVEIQVTSTVIGVHPNSVSAVTTTQISGGTGSGPVNLTVVGKPTISKAFAPATMGVGGTSQLTLTVSNPTASALTGVSFTDTYPANLVNSANPAATTTCTGGTVTAAANAGSVSLAGGTLAASASCTVTVNVTSALAGAYANTSGGVSSVETGAAGTGSNTATLTVVGTQLTKAFIPASISPGGISILTFTVANGAGNPLQPGFGFTDTLPAGLTVSGTPTVSQCGGSVSSTANSISLNSGSLALGAASCTVSVNVTTSTVGSYTNNATNISGLSGGLTAAGVSATLNVLVAPNIAKSFLPNSIAPGAKSTLTIVLSNASATAATAAAFTDNFPSSSPAGGAMTVASPLTVTNSCGGTLTDSANGVLAAGATGIKLSAGEIPANGSCTITIEVTATRSGTATTSYLNTIPAGGLTSSGGSNLAAANATLNLPLPLISKVFSPTVVATGAPSVLTITLTNNSANPYTAATFTDTFPTAPTPGQMRLDDATTSTTCVGGVLTDSTGVALATNSTSIKLTGGTIPANGSCTVTVNVEGSARGIYTNTIPVGTLVTSAGANDILASDVLTVQEPDLQVTKSHVGNFIVGSTGTYTLQANNLLGNRRADQVITITDTLPAGLTLATPLPAGTNWTCGNNLPTIPTTVSCNTPTNINAGATNGNAITINVNVLPAAFPSVTNTATISYNGIEDTTNNTANDLTVVMGPPTVTKSFSPAAITVGQPSALSIVITNPNPTAAITGAVFTDTYPTGLVNTATPAGSITGTGCSGTVTAAVNGTSLSLTGGVIPANSSCTVTVNVTSAAVNAYLNSSGPVTTTNSGTGLADSATLTVRAKPTITKGFSPSTVFVGEASVLTLTITNPNPAPLSAVAFTDTYPAGLVNTSTPAAAISGLGCSGSFTAAPNGPSLSLSGGSIPANSSCTVTVNVTSALAASYSNTSDGVSSAETGSAGAVSNTAALNVTVAALLTVTKTTATPVVVNSAAGTTATYTITVTNSGGTEATGVKLTDSLPPGFSYASTASVSVNGVATTQFSVTPGATPQWDTTPAGGFVINPGATLEVTFTANIAGTVTSGPYNNSASVISSSPGVSIVDFDGSVNSTDNVLVTSASLTVSKTTSTPTVTNTASGTSATYSVTVTNSGSGAASGVKVTDNLPPGFSYASTTGVTLNGSPVTAGNFQVDTSGSQTPASPLWDTIPAAGFTVNPGQSLVITFVANISSAVSGGSYNNSATASSTNASSIVNFDGAFTNIEDVTVIPAGVAITGMVYSDINHNASLDGGEVGTGLSLFIKLATSMDNTCLSPGLQVAAVDSGASGAYSFSGVVPGEYCLIVSTNSNLNDLTPVAPSGWLFSGFTTGIRLATVVTRAISVQNIGLFRGSKLSGVVFSDTGVGGGVANDGLQNGGEAGIGGVSVKASSGATTLETATTDGSGSYTLWIPFSASGSIQITDTNGSGYISTGGAPGNTFGSYTRASDVTSFNFVSGSIYTGVNFGNVPVNRFVANGQQSGAPGNVLFYPHQFNAGSGGSVVLSVVSASSWPVVMFRDLNCNGVIDAGDPVISADPVSLAANVQLCIVNKVTIPAGTALGVQDAATLQAVFTYTNASPALASTLLVIDSTTVGAGSSGLVLTKTTDKATALPGDTINYTVSYQNNSSAPLGNIVISDATPAFTTFVSAGCTLPLPTAITQCTFATSSAPGGGTSIQWTLNGSLNPASSGQVVFRVTVKN